MRWKLTRTTWASLLSLTLLSQQEAVEGSRALVWCFWVVRHLKGLPRTCLLISLFLLLCSAGFLLESVSTQSYIWSVFLLLTCWPLAIFDLACLCFFLSTRECVQVFSLSYPEIYQQVGRFLYWIKIMYCCINNLRFSHTVPNPKVGVVIISNEGG